MIGKLSSHHSKMANIKSEQLYSPQNYLMCVTGFCFCNNDVDDDVKYIHDMLKRLHVKTRRHWKLNEIMNVVQDNAYVVLVDCMVYNEKTNEYDHKYVWWEVPEDFEEV